VDFYLQLAKQTVEAFVKACKAVSPPVELPPEMKKRAGVFVSLHTKSGELRGCIGTFLPTRENIAQEIIQNAISACSQDPRFLPITEAELPDLVYSVDILSEPKKLITDYRQLNTKKYGLIVSAPDGRKGLLLPDLEGVDTPEEQFRICCLKGGIDPKEKVTLQIFTVERHSE